MLYLQSVLEELVHLGHLGGNGQVDGAVADLDDESALDLRVDLGDNLEPLAVGDVLRLGDGGLEAGQGLVVESLVHCQHFWSFFSFPSLRSFNVQQRW